MDKTVWPALICIAVPVFFWALAFWCLRCIHAWEFVDKTEFKPAIEDLKPPISYFPWDLQWLLRRTVVIVVRCHKCGRVKTIRESST